MASSVVLYIAVAVAAVFSHAPPNQPLTALFPGLGAQAFSVTGVIAVANGVLVQIVMLARLFYGMADRGQLPTALAVVRAGNGVPARATLLAGGLVLGVTLLVPFERLLTLATMINLGLFALVAIALCRLHRRLGPSERGRFAVPRFVPPLAALVSILLMLSLALG